MAVGLENVDCLKDNIICTCCHPRYSIMIQSFQHFKQAVRFVMTEFELSQDEAFSFVVQYMSTEGNTLTLDISPLAYGTYQQ